MWNVSKTKEKTDSTKHKLLWDNALSRFPYGDFPWEVFPPEIARSLMQNARSCATSAVAMPGAAMAIMASVLGRTVSVSPKGSWNEPLIIWSADIRSSGEGKTPPVRLLLRPIYEAQREADQCYQEELKDWKLTGKKNGQGEPKRPRARYATDLTVEGLRVDIGEGHGGLICVLDELSAMISSQNQYKTKGSDRETWLTFWDGHDARVTRASHSMTISGARISIVGGVQPAVFKRIFGDDNGIYMEDGTAFRFLFTCEKNPFVSLTGESWDEVNRMAWEDTIYRAIKWGDDITTCEPHVLRLSPEAADCLWRYRNRLYEQINQFPEVIGGFIPKAVSYAIRIAGVLYCFRCFSQGTSLGTVLQEDDFVQAIRVVEFYLSHTVRAMKLICGQSDRIETTGPAITLARTLVSLRDSLDAGRLAVGFICEKYNEICKPTEKLSSAKAMGSLLRELKLTVTVNKHDANGRRGVHCLIWDAMTESFLQDNADMLEGL